MLLTCLDVDPVWNRQKTNQPIRNSQIDNEVVRACFHAPRSESKCTDNEAIPAQDHHGQTAKEDGRCD